MKTTNFLSEKHMQELKRIMLNTKIFYNKNKLSMELIKKFEKNRKEIYKQISFLKGDVKLSEIEIDDLVKKGYLVYLSQKENRLTLTFKALLVLEYNLNYDRNLMELLDNLNTEFFSKTMKLSKEMLESREKAIILGLLGINSISENYAIRIDEGNAIYFKDAVDLAAKFIKTLGIDYDDGSIDKLWTYKVIGEGPVLSEMRRTNKLPLKTDNLYKNNDGKRYVDILTNNHIDNDKMIFLLKILFNFKPLSFEEKKRLVEILDRIQNLEFRIFKSEPSFDLFKIRKDIRRIVENFRQENI